MSTLSGIQSDFELSLLIAESAMSQVLLISHLNIISMLFSSQYSNAEFLLLGFEGYAYCMSQAAFGSEDSGGGEGISLSVLQLCPVMN